MMLDLFSMLEFNVSLLVVLEPMPTYAKPSYNLCIYKEACRPSTLLIENVVEHHVSPLSLLSHEVVHTSLGSFDSCLVNVNDACMNSLDDDSSIVRMLLMLLVPSMMIVILMMLVHLHTPCLATTPWKRDICSILWKKLGWKGCLIS